ncbi:MAG: aspartate kinase [Chlamydiales bacterium]|nr:aspartate kinase [Chlamydiales bacterium]
MKFGGAAVASAHQFSEIAEIILNKSSQFRVVAVVSAMGDMTDDLLALARKVHPEPPLRELDMLISVGERISISLLAMALHLKGKEAISFTGSQSGIITSSVHSDARIVDVKPQRVRKHLEEGKVVIVAGFQGVSREGEITTLGRGGSDTTAVALGVALGACRVEFYKDVPGICEEDPKINPYARVFEKLSYGEMLQLLQKGGQILHSRCVELAKKNLLKLHVRSFSDFQKDFCKGTVIEEFSAVEPDLQRSIYEE